jgi:hypothetical protein
VLRGEAGHALLRFADVGALAWYLRMSPWLVEEFSIAGCRPRLVELHERGVELTVRQPLFWLEAINE